MRLKYKGKKPGGFNIYLPIGSMAKGKSYVKKVVVANPFADLSPEDGQAALLLDPQHLELAAEKPKAPEAKEEPKVEAEKPKRGRKPKE